MNFSNSSKQKKTDQTRPDQTNYSFIRKIFITFCDEDLVLGLFCRSPICFRLFIVLFHWNIISEWKKQH